jgi:hypothetical protein
MVVPDGCLFGRSLLGLHASPPPYQLRGNFLNRTSSPLVFPSSGSAGGTTRVAFFCTIRNRAAPIRTACWRYFAPSQFHLCVICLCLLSHGNHLNWEPALLRALLALRSVVGDPNASLVFDTASLVAMFRFVDVQSSVFLAHTMFWCAFVA